MKMSLRTGNAPIFGKSTQLAGSEANATVHAPNTRLGDVAGGIVHDLLIAAVRLPLVQQPVLIGVFNNRAGDDGDPAQAVVRRVGAVVDFDGILATGPRYRQRKCRSCPTHGLKTHCRRQEMDSSQSGSRLGSSSPTHRRSVLLPAPLPTSCVIFALW